MIVYQIQDYRFFPEQSILVSEHGREVLEKNAVSLLCCLCEQDGAPVPKQTLMAHVWSGKTVSDNTLSRLITRLRRAFGESSQNCRYILTVPKVGYRLGMPVERVTDVETLEAAETPAGIETDSEKTEKAHIAQPVESDFPEVKFESVDTPLVTKRPPACSKIAVAITVLLIMVVGLLVLSDDRPVSQAPSSNAPQSLYTTLNTVQDAAYLSASDTLILLSAEQSNEHAHVYKLALGTGQSISLDSRGQRISAMAVSPDGNFLTFVSHGERCEIRRLSLTGPFHVANSEHLVSCNPNSLPSIQVGPAGRYLYFTDRASEDAPYQVFRMNIGDRSLQALRQPITDGMGNYGFSVSPLGESVLILNGSGEGEHSLYVVSLENGQTIQDVTISDAMASVTWLADGEAWLALSEDADGNLHYGEQQQRAPRLDALNGRITRVSHQNGDGKDLVIVEQMTEKGKLTRILWGQFQPE